MITADAAGTAADRTAAKELLRTLAPRARVGGVHTSKLTS